MAAQKVRHTKKVCAYCGEEKMCTYGPNPFKAEIDDNFKPEWLCDEDRELLADEV